MTPGAVAAVADRGLLEMYATMLLIRRFEERCGQLLAQGRIPGFLHLSIGQEAVAVGVCSALRPEDLITSTHRGHGHCIAKGGSVDRIMAEIFGRVDGYCLGRSGSMHVADHSVGILGANAIVGAGIPIAVGASLTAAVAGDERVAVAFFGDGACAEGVFHESLNLAALWDLAVVFVCENNHFAEMSPLASQLANVDLTAYGEAHGIASRAVDGNDVIAAHEAAASAVERARAGGGPSLLVCETYRWRGHFEGDPARYRDPEEVERWKARDPLRLLAERLVHEGLADDGRLERIDADTVKRIEAAVAFADASPEPTEPELISHVHAA